MWDVRSPIVDVGEVVGRSDKRPEGSMTCVIAGVFIGSLVCGGFIVFADGFAVYSMGSAAFLSLQPVVGVGSLVGSLAIAAVFIPHGIRQRNLKRSAALLATTIFGIAFTVLCIRAGGQIRMAAFADLASRSTPLVAAIKSFEQKYGRPPESLSALAPEFIASVPWTGLRAYPSYGYFVGKENRFSGNPWVLSVFSSSGILNFDTFVYYPLQNYPLTECGNRFERIGEWAYLYE